MYQYHAEVLELLEPDALRLLVDLGLDTRKEIISLLLGVRCPHLGEAGRDKAMEVAQAWCWNRNGQVIVNCVRTASSEQGRYRVVVTDQHGMNLADALIACGVGVRVAA